MTPSEKTTISLVSLAKDRLADSSVGGMTSGVTVKVAAWLLVGFEPRMLTAHRNCDPLSATVNGGVV